jgi:hypothetical protein
LGADGVDRGGQTRDLAGEIGNLVVARRALLPAAQASFHPFLLLFTVNFSLYSTPSVSFQTSNAVHPSAQFMICVLRDAMASLPSDLEITQTVSSW